MLKTTTFRAPPRASAVILRCESGSVVGRRTRPGIPLPVAVGEVTSPQWRMEDSNSNRNVDDFVEHFAFAASLRDGTPVRLRPIAPKDRERLVEGWKHLSSKSRYLRFMRPKGELSDGDLTYLTQIDYSDHFAWAAETLDTADTPGVGIARYIRVADEPEVAEAALAVVDELQRRGLGRLLLEALAQSARANGISRFRAYVAGSNTQVLDALSAIGADRVGFEDGLFIMEIPLPETEFDRSALYAALREAAIDYARRTQADGA